MSEFDPIQVSISAMLSAFDLGRVSWWLPTATGKGCYTARRLICYWLANKWAMTQAEIGRYTGMSYQQVNNYLYTSHERIDAKTLKKIELVWTELECIGVVKGPSFCRGRTGPAPQE